MSELEAIKLLINGQPFDMYFKSDVDEVLAEKDKQLRHQKYKRCLAMAAWCLAQCQLYGFANNYQKTKHYANWHRAWLAIANKFKEAN